jgi:hypothetical protein
MVAAEGAKYPVPPEVLARFGELGRESSTLTVLRHTRIAERMGLSGTDHKTWDLVRRAEQPSPPAGSRSSRACRPAR